MLMNAVMTCGGPNCPLLSFRSYRVSESSSEDEQEAFQRKMEDKRYKDYVKTAEEELCPKATGYETKLEKKAMARERKRFRDTSPGLSDKVLLGDSSSEFHNVVGQG